MQRLVLDAQQITRDRVLHHRLALDNILKVIEARHLERRHVFEALHRVVELVEGRRDEHRLTRK